MPDQERLQIAYKLTSSGLFLPKGVNVVRWDGTPHRWGRITYRWADTRLGGHPTVAGLRLALGEPNALCVILHRAIVAANTG